MTSLDLDVPRSQMICMLAIPAWLSCGDLLNFLAPCCPGIRRVRIIRDKTPNQYMCLILFRSQVCSDSIELERILLIYVFHSECRNRQTSVTRHSMGRLTIQWSLSSVIWCMSLRWRFVVMEAVATGWVHQ